LPVDHLDRLPAGLELGLGVALPMLHDEPHAARVTDLEAELVAAAATDLPAPLLAGLAVPEGVEREHLAGHRRLHDPAHHDLLRRRVVARLLRRLAAVDRHGRPP